MGLRMGPAPHAGKHKEKQVGRNIQELWGNSKTSTRRMLGQKSGRRERKKYVSSTDELDTNPEESLKQKENFKLMSVASRGCKGFGETPCRIDVQTKLTAVTSQLQLWASYK